MADFSLDGLRATLRSALGPEGYSPQIDRTLVLSFRGHQGQFRDQSDNDRSGRVPYIVHPVGVAILALNYFPVADIENSRDDVVSACLAHDLLEDTAITPLELEGEASERVVQIVMSLTKPLVQPELARQERDEALMKQIIKGGRTAGFVKICDYLHNIGRPDQTPRHILEKSVRKGRSLYVQIFDEFGLPLELKAEYLRRLEAAEAQGRARAGPSEAEQPALSLSDAMKHCVERADRKVLERHDIIDLLGAAFGSQIVRTMSIDEFIDHVLIKENSALSQKLRARIAKGLSTGELLASSFEGAEVEDICKGMSRIITAPRAEAGVAATTDSDFVFVCIPAKREPHWATPHALRMLYIYVSERLRLQEKKRISDAEATIAKLGLGVPVHDVQELQLTHNDLYELRSLTEYAEFACGQIVRAVEFDLSAGRLKNSIVNFEARAKSPQSIVAKMLRRRITIDQIEDLVGLRIVCLSQRDVPAIVRTLEACIAKLVAKAEGGAGNGKMQRSVESVAGYRATHATFQFPGQHPQDKWLNCELQVRTVYQDAWAKLSEQLSYKKHRVLAKRMNAGLEELAELRDRADVVVDRMMSSDD